jgi:hypothetical protein
MISQKQLFYEFDLARPLFPLAKQPTRRYSLPRTFGVGVRRATNGGIYYLCIQRIRFFLTIKQGLRHRLTSDM